MTMDEIAAKIQEHAASGGFSRSVKFDCGGDGVVVIDRATVTTVDQPVDCTVALSKENFEALISGELNPTMAFMMGKLKVTGDMSVAMQLSQLL